MRFHLEEHYMQCFCKALAVASLSTSAIADECTITLWDLFLPKIDVELEKISDERASLLLKNASHRGSFFLN